jgi:hypothetical protein
MIGETRFKIGRSGQKPYEQPGSKAESNDQSQERRTKRSESPQEKQN